MDYETAHRYSSNHRKQVLESSKCGCFYCLAIYSPSEIQEWVDEDEKGIGKTALCPRCGIDSVISDKSGVPITDEFLKGMNHYWFE